MSELPPQLREALDVMGQRGQFGDLVALAVRAPCSEPGCVDTPPPARPASVAGRRNEGDPMTEAAEAAPEVALPPFSGDHAVCAKCRNIGASITYQQAVTFRQVDVFNGRRRHGPQPERLERECDRCDYQWDEALPTAPPSTDLPPDTPRLALLSALNSPPYDLAAGKTGTPLNEAEQLIDEHHAAVLREAADRYQGFIDAADTGADPRYWCGINDMVLGLRHMAAEKAEATDGDR